MKKIFKRAAAILSALAICTGFAFSQEAEDDLAEGTAVEAVQQVEAAVEAKTVKAENVKVEAANSKSTKGKPKPVAIKFTNPFKKAVKPETLKSGVGIKSLNVSELEIAVDALDYSDPELSIVSEAGLSNRDVKWKSSDIYVVKVDQRGRLFPNSEGKATVTVIAKDGSKAECEVTVSRYGKAPSSAGLNISTQLSGDASVVFGVDLDTGRAAFGTDQNIKLKMDILNLGEVWAGDTGHPVWGEIRILTEGDPLRYGVDDDSGKNMSVNTNDFHIVVDRAKIHVGGFNVTLFDRDNNDLGFANYTTGSDVAYSFFSADTEYRYGKLKQRTLQSYMSSHDPFKRVWGLSAGYEYPNFIKLDADFASTMQWITGSGKNDTADPSHDATDWVYKISGEFNWIPGLSVKGGYSNGILGKDSIKKPDMRFGFEADYQWDFYDIYYLKPSAGITMIQTEGEGDLYKMFTCGLMLGWEEKQSAFDYWDTKYSEDKNGCYPGIAFALQYADEKIAADTAYFSSANQLVFNNDLLILHASFNTGDNLFIKNLEAVGAVDVIDVLSDAWCLGYTLGAAYNIKLADTGCSLKPKAFVTRYHDSFKSKNDYAYIKAGIEFSYQRINISFDYESNDIINGYNDGKNINRLGNFETTVKVSF